MKNDYAVWILVIARWTIRYELCSALRECGYIVHEANADRDAIRQLETRPIDLFIVELTVEGEALSLVRRIRTQTQMPLLMISEIMDEQVSTTALDAGADDYVAIPLNMVDSLARVRALLRRGAWIPKDMSIRLGSLCLDLTEHCFYIGKQEVHLTLVETKLLHILFANPERVVTYQQFMAFVWGQFTNKELASLRTHMYQLRQKITIGEPPSCQIVSEPQTGYRLHLNLFPKTPIQNHEPES